MKNNTLYKYKYVDKSLLFLICPGLVEYEDIENNTRPKLKTSQHDSTVQIWKEYFYIIRVLQSRTEDRGKMAVSRLILPNVLLRV